MTHSSASAILSKIEDLLEIKGNVLEYKETTCVNLYGWNQTALKIKWSKRTQIPTSLFSQRFGFFGDIKKNKLPRRLLDTRNKIYGYV